MHGGTANAGAATARDVSVFLAFFAAVCLTKSLSLARTRQHRAQPADRHRYDTWAGEGIKIDTKALGVAGEHDTVMENTCLTIRACIVLLVYMYVSICMVNSLKSDADVDRLSIYA